MPSLLRYPGGKSRGKLKDKIIEHIAEHHSGGSFGELFFGGGGITLNLIKEKVVDNVIICEKDIALADLWWQIIDDPRDLIRKVERFTPSVRAFKDVKERVLAEQGNGFDFLVVNRLSHGGRGVKAGPQGGHNQQGQYKIDCRWKTETLVKTIGLLHRLFGTVDVDWFCGSYDDAPWGIDYLYMDPPYWSVGDELYQHNFTEDDHLALFDYLRGRGGWLLSYNNCPEVRELYQGFNMEVTGTVGNGGEKPNSELLIWA
jgi:DNA adenine methylase